MHQIERGSGRNLLLIAFADAARVATVDMLDEVTNDMRLEWTERPALLS